MPPVTWFHAARTMPMRSKPGFEQNDAVLGGEHRVLDVQRHLVDRTLIRLPCSGTSEASDGPVGVGDRGDLVVGRVAGDGTRKTIQPTAKASTGPRTSSAMSR